MKKFRHFWLDPASARPLAFLRIGVSATLLLQAFLVSRSVFDFYGTSGILQGAIERYLGGSPLPDIGLVSSWLGHFGLSESTAILAVCGLYLATLVALLLGWHTRGAAVVAWITHATLVSGQITSYGVDQFAHVFLFYLILVPAGHALSLDRHSGRVAREASPLARWGLRLMQIHLCIAYFFGGVDKAMGPQWWDGDAIWRALMLPLYSSRDLSWLAMVPWLPKLFGLGTLLVETGYGVFIWPRRTRAVWIALTVGMHLGIAVFLGLGVFSLMMSVLSLSLFAVSAEPRRSNVKLEPERFGVNALQPFHRVGHAVVFRCQ